MTQKERLQQAQGNMTLIVASILDRYYVVAGIVAETPAYATALKSQLASARKNITDLQTSLQKIDATIKGFPMTMAAPEVTDHT
jgi:hypothetical protein